MPTETVAIDLNGHDSTATYDISPYEKLRRDLLSAAVTLTPHHVRYLVDLYYAIQTFRTTSGNQVKAAEKNAEPHEVVEWVHHQTRGVEHSIVRILDTYSESREDGRWARSVFGIGPVITAGLMAHIDVTRTKTASGVWLYAGLDPTCEWYGKEKAAALVNEYFTTKEDVNLSLEAFALSVHRKAETLRRDALRFGKSDKVTRASLIKALSVCPYNQKLKVLSFKIAESFVKFSNHDECYYGRLWKERKAFEEAQNEVGNYAEQAALQLTKKNYRGDTKAKACYQSGKLPPAHVHARSMRWVAKIFLSHWFDVAYEVHYGEPPPKPYIFAIGGHTHYIPPYGWKPPSETEQY